MAKSFSINSKKISDLSNVGLPAAAIIISTYKQDEEGGMQALASFLITQGAVLGLKSQIKVTRPNGTNDRSVISGHTALSFMGAAYLEERYGWHYSTIPYLLAVFTGYSRVNVNDHRWSEVISGALLGQLVTSFITTPYKDKYSEQNLFFQFQIQPKNIVKTSKKNKSTLLGFNLQFRIFM